jgi:aminopeptidase N
MEWKIVKFSTTLLQILVLITFTAASPLLEEAVLSNIRTTEINYRLPTNVIPSTYSITLDPLIEADDPKPFTGEVKITVKVIEETDSITLHYNDLSIKEIKVTRVSTSRELSAHHEYDSVTHFCVIKIDTEEEEEEEEDRLFKENEEYIITIDYFGYHRSDMYGFYRSSYKDEHGNTV